MSHAIVLDTYDYAQALKKANVSDAQIEVEVARDKERTKAINELINIDLATKHDIALIQKDLIAIRNELKQDGKNLKSHVDTFGYLLCGLIVLGFSIIGFLIKN